MTGYRIRPVKMGRPPIPDRVVIGAKVPVALREKARRIGGGGRNVSKGVRMCIEAYRADE
jgi:hypothetical protein